MRHFRNRDGKEIRPAVTVGELRKMLAQYDDDAEISLYDVSADIFYRGFFDSSTVKTRQRKLLTLAPLTTEVPRDEYLFKGAVPATTIDAEGDLVLTGELIADAVELTEEPA